jgi:hypothetical protein
MLIHKIISNNGPIRGLTDTTECLRVGEAQPMTILVDDLFRSKAGQFAELGRGQSVCA